MLVKEYLGLSRAVGSLVFVENISEVSYDELVEIKMDDGTVRHGKVIEINKNVAVIQVFEGTGGINLVKTGVRFLGKPFAVNVSLKMLGRMFNAFAEPIDKGPRIASEKVRDVNGQPINPVSREYPRDCIQTGVSAIDIPCTLVRGQKLPIFSGNGLPHNMLAAQIARQANISEKEGEKFAIVFAAMGITKDTAEFFKKSFEESGAFNKVVMFQNLADDPPIERLILPRTALTVAEYFAFDEDYHVLVIMTDVTNYCEALREISSSRNEVPSRKGYPGYLYSDLAALYERAGRIKGRDGSITQIPILTMPNDDITHPVPDMTGYITEGQIVLSRSLMQKGVYPPINILPSLSRLMKDGIGSGKTREDHAIVASQINATYERAQDIAALASVIGEEELSDTDRKILDFSKQLEKVFIGQGEHEKRTFTESLEIAWQLFSSLPKIALERVPEELIKKYLKS